MAGRCEICNRADRADIENAILSMHEVSGSGIEFIAEQFGCDLTELKRHAMFHLPLCDQLMMEDPKFKPGVSTEEVDPREAEHRTSLTRKLKLREADILEATSHEYLITLKALGRRINRLTKTSTIEGEDEDLQLRIAKYLTKPMVELYIGVGGEIRSNVKQLAEIDRMLNGPQENTGSGLMALAKAIQGSGSDD